MAGNYRSKRPLGELGEHAKAVPWKERHAGLLQTSLQGREYLLLSRRLQHESANALCELSDDNRPSMITLVTPGYRRPRSTNPLGALRVFRREGEDEESEALAFVVPSLSVNARNIEIRCDTVLRGTHPWNDSFAKTKKSTEIYGKSQPIDRDSSEWDSQSYQ